LKRRVEISTLARRDIARLSDFLSPKNPRAWKAAVAAISARLRSLDQMSERGHLSPDGEVREMFVRFGRAGYVIQYRTAPQEVFVLHIFHSLEER
jgi:plasmid stabilization system protein ParE